MTWGKVPTSSPGARGALVAMLLGGTLLLLHLLGLGLIPTGPSEFAYFPFTTDPLPFTPMRGFTLEQLAEHASRLLLATPALLLLAWGLSKQGWIDLPRMDSKIHKRIALSVSALSLIYMTGLMLFLYKGRALTDDELTYGMQAMILAEGELGRAAPQLHFTELFTISTGVGYTGKYLLGEPLLQIPGALIGYPGLVHIPLAALTLWLLYRCMSIRAGVRIASWTVILIASSPMFVFTAPTGQSQVPALSAIALAGFGYTHFAGRRPWLGSVALGMAVGFGMLIRPQTMAPVGTVLVVAALIQAARLRRLAQGLFLLVLLGAWAASILWYNFVLSGSFFTLPWYMLEPIERFGFGQVWENSSYVHTPWAALENLLVVAARFNGWWLGWPSSLLLLWFWFRAGRPTSGAWIWIWAGLAVILFESLYYSTGISDTGVAYHFELIVPAAVLGANAVVRGLTKTPRFVTVVLIVHFGIGTMSYFWYQQQRIGRLVKTIHSDSDAALARIPGKAVLFYEVHPSESMKLGWVFNAFPRRYRSDLDRVVTFPRPPGQKFRIYLKHYPGRSCWYYRRSPQNGIAELHRCEDALHLLTRPFRTGPGARILAIRSTAQIMGWYDPWQSRRRRTSKGVNMEFRDKSRKPNPPSSRGR